MNSPFSIGHRASALAAIAALVCVLAGCNPAAGETTTALPDTGTFEQQGSAEEAVVPEDSETTASEEPSEAVAEAAAVSLADIPAYDGSPYVYVNGGEPSFGDEERAAAPGTESYGELDALGRCTAAFAVVGAETMPDEERGSIGEVKPSGWQMAKYDFVEGKYLFNRCHLLGYQLTGENANVRNLITGTRYLNIQGMLPFENAVADYVHATGNHVLMAVTPMFQGDDLVARGVSMMAESVEDGGEGVSFNVFCYNVQPGVAIDYATGDNRLDGTIEGTPLPDVSGAEDATSDASGAASSAGVPTDEGKGAEELGGDTAKSVAEYVLNTNSKKFHVPSCSSVKQMKDTNRQDVKDTRENIVNQGYDPCKRCNP